MKHIDPSEINIINYLTGDMTADEMKLFKDQLDKNQLLREQIEEMKFAQGHLRHWSNAEIQIPSFTPLSFDETLDLGNVSLFNEKESKQQKLSIPNWVKYAAAFLGFVLLLQISGLKINHDGNTLLLSFGVPKSEKINTIVVDEIVAKAIEKYAEHHQGQLSGLKNQMNSDLVKITKALDIVTFKNEASIAKLESAFSRNMDEQYVNMESMVTGIKDNQRQDLEDSFTGLVEYIDNKRVKDQFKIQNAFNEIATAINNQQYQTNALLTSISDEDTGLKSY